MGLQCSSLSQFNIKNNQKKLSKMQNCINKSFSFNFNLKTDALFQKHVNIIKISQIKSSQKLASQRLFNAYNINNQDNLNNLQQNLEGQLENIKKQQSKILEWRKQNNENRNIIQIFKYYFRQYKPSKCQFKHLNEIQVLDEFDMKEESYLEIVVFSESFFNLKKIYQMILEQQLNCQKINNQTTISICSIIHNLKNKIVQIGLLQNWLKGIQALIKQFGYFTINEQMLGINSKKIGKVWISSNIAENKIQKSLQVFYKICKSTNSSSFQFNNQTEKEKLMVLNFLCQIQSFSNKIITVLTQKNVENLDFFVFVKQLKGKNIQQTLQKLQQIKQQQIFNFKSNIINSARTADYFSNPKPHNLNNIKLSKDHSQNLVNKKKNHKDIGIKNTQDLIKQNSNLNRTYLFPKKLIYQQNCQKKYQNNKFFSNTFSVFQHLNNIPKMKTSKINKENQIHNQLFNTSQSFLKNNLKSTCEGNFSTKSTGFNKKDLSISLLINNFTPKLNEFKEKVDNKAQQMIQNKNKKNDEKKSRFYHGASNQPSVFIPKHVKRLRFDQDSFDQSFQIKMKNTKDKVKMVNSLFISAQQTQKSIKSEDSKVKFQESMILRGLKQSNLNQKISN